MARKIVKLPSMSRVVAGAIATLELPLGPTYMKTIFSVTGTAVDISHIERINVYVDGQVVQTFQSLQRLIDLNSRCQRGTDTINEFVLHFFRAELVDLVYRRAGGFGTQGMQTFHIEMELAAGAPADIEMVAHAEVDPVPQPLGAFFRVREFPFSSAVSGQVEVDKLPKGPYYAAIHLMKADVSKVEVEVDQVKVVDATKSILERLQKEASPVPRVPLTAKATSVDWTLEGDLAQCLKTDRLQDFRIRATLDTAGAMDIVTETLDVLG